MKNLTILILAVFISSILFAQSIPPKREFRGAWIATVTNIDWPSGTNPEAQRQQLINILQKERISSIMEMPFY